MLKDYLTSTFAGMGINLLTAQIFTAKSSKYLGTEQCWLSMQDYTSKVLTHSIGHDGFSRGERCLKSQ